VRTEVHGVDLGVVGVDIESRSGRLPDVPQLDFTLVRRRQVLAGSSFPTNLVFGKKSFPVFGAYLQNFLKMFF